MTEEVLHSLTILLHFHFPRALHTLPSSVPFPILFPLPVSTASSPFSASLEHFFPSVKTILWLFFPIFPKKSKRIPPLHHVHTTFHQNYLFIVSVTVSCLWHACLFQEALSDFPVFNRHFSSTRRYTRMEHVSYLSWNLQHLAQCVVNFGFSWVNTLQGWLMLMVRQTGGRKLMLIG